MDLNLNTVVVKLTPMCSKKIQFSLLNNQDTVKLSEFEVTHRDLYTPVDRLPVKNGVLDRRLVRTRSLAQVTPSDKGPLGNNREECLL